MEELDYYSRGVSYYLTPYLIYETYYGAWNSGMNKFASIGDFDDGVDEISAVYDYGNNNMGIWIFDYFMLPPLTSPEDVRGFNDTVEIKARGLNILTPILMYTTGAGNWSLTKTKQMTAGDFDGNGISDLAMMYDYGNNDMGIWLFSSNGLTFNTITWYRSGVGNWSATKSKFMVGGIYIPGVVSDITMMYDYGNSAMGLWNFYYLSIA